jgi:alkylation response protein AidB-like acyl-CoA dehydrogenase
MTNFFDDNEDLKFYIDRGIDWQPLVRLTEYNYRAPDAFTDTKEAVESYRAILDMVGEFSANEVAPHARDIDRQHPTLKDSEVSFPPVLQGIMDQVNALQLHGMCLPRELEGMNCPYLLHLVVTELFARSDVSVAAHVGFHGGMALAGLVFSIFEGSTEFDAEAGRITSTRFQEMIGEIAAGRAWASMDITEPGAGSDMAALTTRAVLEEDGQWYVSGNKIFITSGHAKYHYVVAKTEEQEGNDDFAGLKALSMFLVKAYDDDGQGNRVRHVWFDSLEDKLGHHGSATVAVRYEHSPAQLIGERGDGFRLMLLIMNNARLGIGFESLGICEAACRMAKAYAAERTSMGKTIDRHEMIADYFEEMQTDIQALRALAMDGAFHEEMTHKIRLMLRFLPPEKAEEKAAEEREMARHQRISRRLTPLVKYMGSEKAVEMARRCIQIHGGYGYITEFGAEKLLRDAMVLPIYEGTSQIQSLMVMKDSLMGVLKAPADFVRGAAQTWWRSCFATDSAVRRVARLKRQQYAVLRYLLRRLAVKKLAGGLGQFTKEWDPKRDFALAMLHAERLTRISLDVAVCEVLLGQCQRFPERREVLERYLERAEPRCRWLRDEITSTGDRLLAAMKEQEGTTRA